MTTLEDFEKLDIRVGEIVSVEDFPEAQKSYYKLKIDFGNELGKKKSIGKYTANYSKAECIGSDRSRTLPH